MPTTPGTGGHAAFARRHLRLRALGTLAAEAGAVRLNWLPAHRLAAALLLYLAVERETTRDLLLVLLWPEQETEKARHALSQLLYRLRQQLGEDWIESHGDQLRVSAGVQVDVVAFVEAVERGAWDEALSLYGGPFLGGVHLADSPEFESWVDRQRARLERLCRRASREHVNQRVAARDAAGALNAARAWVDRSPLEDEAQHRLIALLAAAGERTEALAQYAVYERLLAADDLAPLDETRALAARLRSGDVEVQGPNAAIAASAAPAVRVAGGEALPAAGERGAPGPSAPRRVRRRHWVLFLLTTISFGILLGTWARTDRPAASGNTIAVMPFRAAHAASSLARLGEDVQVLLTRALSGRDGLPQAVEWAVIDRMLGRGPGAEASDEAAIALAQRLGVARVLTGELVGTAARVTLVAVLYDTERGRELLRSEVVEPADSLHRIVDRLAALVVAAGTELAPDRSAALTTASLPALRAYLDGESARRRGRYRDAVESFDRAIDIDTAFVAAAMGLRRALSWATGLAARNTARAETLVQLRAAELPDSEQALLRVDALHMSGNLKYNAKIREVESLVRSFPSSLDLRSELADEYFHYGMAAGIGDALERAERLFSELLAEDSTYVEALIHMYGLAVRRRDLVAAVRWGDRLIGIDSAGPWAMRVWHHRARWPALQRQGRVFDLDTLPADVLLHLYGFLPDTAEADATWRAIERAEDDAVRARLLDASFQDALDEGRPGRVKEVFQRAATAPAGGGASWTRGPRRDAQLLALALLWAPDRADAARAARVVQVQVDSFESRRGNISFNLHLNRACVLAHWLLAERRRPAARALLARLPIHYAEWLGAGTEPAYVKPARQGLMDLCTAAIEARIAVDDAAPDALQRVERLEALFRGWPYWSNTYGPFVPMQLIELWERLEQPHRALRVARWQPRHTGIGPLVIDQIAARARLEDQLGYREEAMLDYALFLAHRPRPEPPFDAAVRHARARLTALQQAR